MDEMSITLDSVSCFSDNFMVSREDGGSTIDLTTNRGLRGHIRFDASKWPEIQALVNATIAAFDKAQEEER